MKLKYTLICDAANISQTGKLNILGIFKSINAAKFPCTHPKFTYVSNIEFHRSEIGRHDLKLSLINEDGNEIIPPLNLELNVTPQSLNTNLLLELTNICFPQDGVYQFDLTIDRQHIGSESVNINSTAQIQS